MATKWLTTIADSKLRFSHVSNLYVERAPLKDVTGKVVRDEEGLTIEGYRVIASCRGEEYVLTKAFAKREDALAYIKELLS